MLFRFCSRFAATVTLGLLMFSPLAAWDYTGHRIVNQAALASLPADFPEFVRAPAAAERIAFLAGEPDRWRNVPDLPIKHANGLDHYCDLEHLAGAGVDPRTVSSLRFEFALTFAAGRAAHPEKFPPIDPAKNADRSREWAGFAPWAAAEYYGKLKSAFSYLKAYQEHGGTPVEIENARANILYLMGVMGHVVGDLAQPLHTTMHHHGWVGENPHGYSTWTGIHAWLDGGLIAQTGVTAGEVCAQVRPAHALSVQPRADGRDPVFVQVMDYALAQNARVEPLYQLEKAGKLAPEAADLSEARTFICEQLQVGGEMLGSIWLTAWRNTIPDVYLQGELLRRQQAAATAPAR
ncbi:hypothetical protein [Opitutus terrae]|uniref:S1/P1 Nuclease n=1 Tax=Opitutus terrae (strain DSM 11246 / JCM 15787 / PB90-1) TaxID=452637 RepID=B1ZQR9_OPITP|nr:hypothetical protein [Opitutus terrae]ACB77820.1 conserved hypothetical protein [Opitutus terrae PB90-1]